MERIKVEAEQKEAVAVGDQKANIAKAQGEAEAIRIIESELSRSPDYITWLYANKWNGELPQVTSGIPFVQIPLEGD